MLATGLGAFFTAAQKMERQHPDADPRSADDVNALLGDVYPNGVDLVVFDVGKASLTLCLTGPASTFMLLVSDEIALTQSFGGGDCSDPALVDPAVDGGVVVDITLGMKGTKSVYVPTVLKGQNLAVQYLRPRQLDPDPQQGDGLAGRRGAPGQRVQQQVVAQPLRIHEVRAVCRRHRVRGPARVLLLIEDTVAGVGEHEGEVDVPVGEPESAEVKDAGALQGFRVDEQVRQPAATRRSRHRRPGPGSTSTSSACIGSPQWAQRSSTWLISPQAWWRYSTGGPASPASHLSPQPTITISMSTSSVPFAVSTYS